MFVTWDRLSLVPQRSPLWNARLHAGLTQEELARVVGATRKTISLVERGRSIPSVTLAVAVAHAVDATVEELFSDVG